MHVPRKELTWRARARSPRVRGKRVQLHRSRRTYEAGRPVLPWVFAIARHVYLMHRRKMGRRVRFEERLASEIAASEAGMVVRDDAGIVERDRVRRALAHVPADQREAVLLHHIEGWSFAEIAARLGIRINAAKTRAFRGMRKLRLSIGAEDKP